MAMRQYLTHPQDNSPEVAHVIDGALQIQEINPSGAKGNPFSARTVGFVEVNNTTLPILSLQHGGVGALEMLLRQWDAYNDGQDVAFLDLIVGGTLTGAAFAAVDPGSEFEVDTSATAITGGQIIASLIIPRDTSRDLVGDINSALELNQATPGPLSVVVTDEAGNKKVQIATTLGWLEK